MRTGAWIYVVAALFLSSSVSVLAVAPKVVETVPRDGDRSVDPNLREMRFVFDQDMSRGGYSICGGGPNFPKTVGTPRWVDSRTLVVRVRLVPDHDYQLSVNCPSYKNCRSVHGDPAVPYPLRFRTCGSKGALQAGPLTEADNVEAVEELRRAIDERYSYRDLRRLDWDELFTRYEPKMMAAQSAGAFAEAAAQLLAHVQDMHIWLEVNGRTVHPFKRNIERNYNLSVLEKAVPRFRKRSATVYAGMFNDGIGYVLISTWGRDQAKALEQAYVVLRAFSRFPGLIVDVRPNGGGAEPLAQEFAGCFIDKPVLYAKHVYRSAEAPGGFDTPHERVLQPNKARPQYRGKVAVLMGQANMSSCEAFLLMMKQVPRCKLIGARSYGSSGNPKPTDLGNGVTALLPSWKALTPEGTCFEGKGIVPDIAVKATQTQLQSHDPVIEAALKWLRSP